MTTVNEDLQAFMKRFDEREAAEGTSAHDRLAREKAFRQGCNDFFDMTIAVQFELFRQALQTGRHTVEIARERGGEGSDPSIAFVFKPRGWTEEELPPEVRFTADTGRRKIALFFSEASGPGSSSGIVGEFRVEEITQDFVRKYLMQIINSVA